MTVVWRWPIDCLSNEQVKNASAKFSFARHTSHAFIPENCKNDSPKNLANRIELSEVLTNKSH